MQKGCPKCGRMIDSKYENCPNCNYNFKEIDNFFQKVEEKKYVEDEKYGGFIKRLIAGLIDIILIDLICYLVNIYVKMSLPVLIIVAIIIYILGNAVLERTTWRGSVGKKLLKLEVTDEYENPVTFSKAIVRNICKFANVITLGIGFLICVAPPYKQTLGDRISKTLVINKIKIHEEERNDVAPIFKRVVAFIIDIALIVALLIGKNELMKYLSSNNIYEVTKEINEIISGLIVLAYFPVQEGKKGQTIGKKMLGIKVVNLDDSDITYIKSFIREIFITIDILTLGFLLPLSNNKNQTVKDLITKTVITNY